MVYSVCQQCNLAPKLPTISDAFRYVTELQDCQDDAFPTCDKAVIVKPVLEGGREREWKLQISERGAQASAGLEWLESWPEHRRERGHKRVNSSEKGWGGRVFGLKAMKRLWERKQSGSRHELFRKEQSKEDLVVKRGENHFKGVRGLKLSEGVMTLQDKKLSRVFETFQNLDRLSKPFKRGE